MQHSHEAIACAAVAEKQESRCWHDCFVELGLLVHDVQRCSQLGKP